LIFNGELLLKRAALEPTGVKRCEESTGYIKLQIPAGQANPSPPVARLGQQGVNIMEFCKAFNAQTQALEKGLPTQL